MAKKTYPRDPEAALNGMFCLNLEERGAYNTLLDLIYSTGNRLADNDEVLADYCRCAVPTWQRIRERLLALSKIVIVEGMIRNPRADKELGKPSRARVKPVSVPALLGVAPWPADAFDRFWAVYPRRIGRGAAEPALARLEASKTVDFGVLLDGAIRYARKVQDHDPKFICHATTWLNGKRWTDDESAIGQGRRRTALDTELDND